jgi:hypothetical protein
VAAAAFATFPLCIALIGQANVSAGSTAESMISDANHMQSSVKQAAAIDQGTKANGGKVRIAFSVDAWRLLIILTRETLLL